MPRKVVGDYLYRAKADGYGGIILLGRVKLKEKYSSEYQKRIFARFTKPDPEGQIGLESSAEGDNLLWLIAAPEFYGIEEQMLDYMNQYPEADAPALLKHLDSIQPEGFAPGDDGKDLEDDGIPIEEDETLSEYEKLLLKRYENCADPDQDALVRFMIGNPSYIGKEAELLAYMKKHPDDTIDDLFTYYLDEVVSPDYRKELLKIWIPVDEDD